MQAPDMNIPKSDLLNVKREERKQQRRWTYKQKIRWEE